MVIDSDSSDEDGEKVKFELNKSADTKENKKNALYARFVNVSAKHKTFPCVILLTIFGLNFSLDAELKIFRLQPWIQALWSPG